VRYSRSKLLCFVLLLHFIVWPWFFSRVLNYVPLGHKFQFPTSGLGSIQHRSDKADLVTDEYVKSVHSTQNNIT
jgi:hypothetical protein